MFLFPICFPHRIPYFFSASKQYPGKFLLSYMPRTSTKHEFVTVTPEGLRYRSQIFPSLAALIRWFKEHFRDAIPGTIFNKDLVTYHCWSIITEKSVLCWSYFDVSDPLIIEVC